MVATTPSFDVLALPKVELHVHMEGAIPLPLIRDLCEELKVELDPTHSFIQNSNHPLALYQHHFTIPDKVESLTDFVRLFTNLQKLLISPEIVERVTYAVCAKHYAEGARLLELRYSPGFICASPHNQAKATPMTFQECHEAVLRGQRRAESDLNMVVVLIGIMDRCDPFEQASTVVDFFIRNKATFAAVDLANDEINFSATPFIPLFKRAQAAGLQVTVHAGEAGPAANIHEAIESLGASRIGHGIRLLESPSTVALALQKEVHFEVCPTSNEKTNSVASYRAHPIRQIMDAGISVSINTDDPGVFDVTLAEEYARLVQDHGFTAQEFLTCNLNALRASFASHADKLKIYETYFVPYMQANQLTGSF
jgi:adenosine deaminase